MSAMRGKPSIPSVPVGQELESFLDGGAADEAARRPATAPAVQRRAPRPKPEPVMQKLFRLRWDVAQAITDAAADASVRERRRVTETEIVEKAVRDFLKLK